MDEAMQCYLKARELHLMFTPQTNARARELFLQAINIDGSLHRAKGHLAFSNMHAWLYGWGDIDLAADVRDRAWSALYDTAYPDDSVPHAGSDDYDNWWSVGVALLYYAAHGDAPAIQRDGIFIESIEHYYKEARDRAEQDGAIPEDMADLLADYAEARYFRGDVNEEVDDIQLALDLLDEAKAIGIASHPKWHDWNRAWAHYELGCKLEEDNQADESELAYLHAIDLLTSMPSLPHQYRRTLAVCYAALGWYEEARREGRQFLERERLRGQAYDPGIETRWPYKDPARGEKLRERLRKAGIPAPV
jgi:tetratricopeptide (TPR) repeat protein